MICEIMDSPPAPLGAPGPLVGSSGVGGETCEAGPEVNEVLSALAGVNFVRAHTELACPAVA